MMDCWMDCEHHSNRFHIEYAPRGVSLNLNQNFIQAIENRLLFYPNCNTETVSYTSKYSRFVSSMYFELKKAQKLSINLSRKFGAPYQDHRLSFRHCKLSAERKIPINTHLIDIKCYRICPNMQKPLETYREKSSGEKWKNERNMRLFMSSPFRKLFPRAVPRVQKK